MFELKKTLSLLLLLAICGVIVSCGQEDMPDSIPTVPLSDYMKLEYQYGQLSFQLETQQAVCNSTIEQFQQENVAMINQALQYRQQYEALVNSRSDSRGQLAQVTGEASILRQELEISAQALRVMSDQYEDAIARTKACTPRDFASLAELKEWRIEQKDLGENTLENSQKMQRAAWESGYILSVRPEVPDCIAFVGGAIYRISPAYDKEAESAAKDAETEYICVWIVKAK